MNHQKPFLKNLIERRAKYFKENPNIKENLESYIKKIYSNIFNGTNPKKETLDLIKKVLKKTNNPRTILERFKWFSGSEGGCFIYIGEDMKIIYSNTKDRQERIYLNSVLDVENIKLLHLMN